MKKYFFLFLFFSLSASVSRAQVQVGGDSANFSYEAPREYEIGGVVVSGTRFLDEQVLINLSGLLVGDTIEIPGEKISRAISNLWKQGLFSDIKISIGRVQGNRVFLDLQLSEKPRLSRFTFSKGVSKSEADKIREKIQLQRDKVITENLLTNTKNAVKDFYIDKMYLNVQVDIKEYRDTQSVNRDILEIIVEKGKKVHVKSIEFEVSEA